MTRTTTINLTAPTVSGQIAEARTKLDEWLRHCPGPPRGEVQTLRLMGINPLRYELSTRPQVSEEARTIL